jgi:hypothetical protein
MWGRGLYCVRHRRPPSSNRGRARDFSVLQNVHTSCRTHPASCSVATSVKWPGREAEYLHASSSDIKNGRSLPPFPIYAVLAWTVKPVPSFFFKRRMVTH